MAAMDIEVFECQRYRPMAGWSSDYLLPTDRNPFRIPGCKKCWKTLAEVDVAMLAPGWAWEQAPCESGSALQPIQWKVDMQSQDVDKDGWSYASGFSNNFEGGAAKASLQRVVRWRRLVRTQTFSGIEALTGDAGATVKGSKSSSSASVPMVTPVEPMTEAAAPLCPVCPNVDLEASARIQKQLAEAIAQASLYGEWSTHALVVLKAQLLEVVSGSPAGEKDGTLEAALAAFVASQRSVSARMSETLSRKSQDAAAVAARLQEVQAKFPVAEQEALAVLAVQKFHPNLACGVQDAAHDPHKDCRFRPISCSNPGCKVRCCAHALSEHDDLCPKKLVACVKCGEEVPRCELSVHGLAACPEREACCVFSSLGCEVPLTHRDLTGHLEECTQAHMMLMMRALLEQREDAKSMQDRLAELEAKCAQTNAERDTHLHRYGALEKKAAGLETQLAALEKKAAEDLKKVVAPVDELKKKVASSSEEARKRIDASAKEARTRVESLEKIHKAEVGTLRAEIAALRASTGDIAALRTELDSMKDGLESATKVQT